VQDEDVQCLLSSESESRMSDKKRREENSDPTDRILAEICKTSGLDESATIREWVEALRELGWTASQPDKDGKWRFVG